MTAAAPPMPALAGGAGSGKSTLAVALAEARPGAYVVHLDDYYHHDPDRAPSVPVIGGPGRTVDYSDPGAMDLDRIDAAIGDAPRDATFVVVEGTFALALPTVRDRARWTAFVDTPADVRIVRKALRKLDQDSEAARRSLAGYLLRGRDAHELHVAPGAHSADLVLDGMKPTPDLVQRLLKATVPG
ncbi:hypothetical protein OG552_23800 [Streptomyces sp. NBC_01476]|uniref:uridine kinase family protein n=1 Tax=Streptomyces sp. NBC_01476 TaxID=2903881 RepID=UPI002E36C2E2|nr:hypothetical protein [Streptomyces sp. NBC_01476]